MHQQWLCKRARLLLCVRCSTSSRFWLVWVLVSCTVIPHIAYAALQTSGTWVYSSSRFHLCSRQSIFVSDTSYSTFLWQNYARCLSCAASTVETDGRLVWAPMASNHRLATLRVPVEWYRVEWCSQMDWAGYSHIPSTVTDGSWMSCFPPNILRAMCIRTVLACWNPKSHLRVIQVEGWSMEEDQIRRQGGSAKWRSS